MNNAMVVPLQVPGVGEAVAGLNRTAAAFKDVAKAQGQASQASEKLVRAQGPNQRLVRAQIALHNALLHGGSLAEIADAQRAVARLQQLLAPKTPRIPPPPKLPPAPKVPALPRVGGPHQALAHAQAALAAATTPEEAADAQLAIQRAMRQLNPGAFNRTQRIPPPPSVAGPHQALAHAQAALASASTPAQAADAQLAIRRAQQQINHANQPPPSPLSRINQLVSSSRLNMGGVSPLVGRGMAALGLSAEFAAPIALFAASVSIAASAVKALADAADEGGRTLKEISDAAAVSGGTGGQAGRLRALGVGPGFAASLRERLATDPLAMMTAAQIGVRRVLPTQFGPQNNSAVVIDVLNRLKAVQKAGGDPTRAARLMGAEALLPLLNMSDRATISLLKTADALGKLADKTKVISADWDAAKKRLEMAQDRVKGAGFSIGGPGATFFSNKLSDALDLLASVMEKYPDQFLTAVEASAVLLAPALAAPIVATFEAFRIQMHAAQKSQAQAAAANTAALNNNTTALTKPNVYGGGGRASGALPAQLNGPMLNNATRSKAIQLGYW